MLTYTVVQKTKPLLYFQMTSTNTDQYTQILVHRIRSESSMFTCVIASFNETRYQLRLILKQTVDTICFLIGQLHFFTRRFELYGQVINDGYLFFWQSVAMLDASGERIPGSEH